MPNKACIISAEDKASINILIGDRRRFLLKRVQSTKLLSTIAKINRKHR
jgi:hypothetical protein